VEANSKPQPEERSAKNRQQRWIYSFFTIWTGQAFSLIGSQLVQFALIWWLTRTTGSATVLATASLVGLLPQVFMGLVAGALIDRWNRRITMIVADSLIALATLALAVLFLTGTVQVWHVYLLMFLRSAAGAFHWPAMAASTTLMVPKEHLARIQGFNQMLNGGLNIISAPLGALLLELLPMQGVLSIDIFTALLAVLSLFFVAIPQPPRAPATAGEAGKTSVWQDIKAGLRYTVSFPGLLIILIMAALINMLLNPAFALLPLLVTRHFNGQAWHLATLESLSSIGIILGGLGLGVWGGFRSRVATSLCGLLMIGAGCLAIGLLPGWAFGYAVAAMFVLGLSTPITNGPLMAAVQAVVDPEMQGRVFTLIMSVSSAMSPLGLILAGPVGDLFGVQTWFLWGGVLTAVMGVAGFFIPAVMNFEKGPKAAGRPALQETGELPAVPGD
jgi:DHA3 family macrolide efflux protein-like MFS transporter